MSLDLSKAIEAVVDRLDRDDCCTCPACCRDDAVLMVQAVLPHILDALASEQEAKAAHLIEIGSYWAQTNVHIAEFLRAKAERAE